MWHWDSYPFLAQAMAMSARWCNMEPPQCLTADIGAPELDSRQRLKHRHPKPCCSLCTHQQRLLQALVIQKHLIGLEVGARLRSG